MILLNINRRGFSNDYYDKIFLIYCSLLFVLLFINVITASMLLVQCSVTCARFLPEDHSIDYSSNSSK